MTTGGDPVPVVATVADALTANDLTMDGHVWAAHNTDRARRILCESDVSPIAGLASRLAEDGWAVVTLPMDLSDDYLRRAAAGVLAGVGVPFFSIDGGRGLWLDGLSAPEKDPHCFGGFAAQALHIDAPNVTEPPDYTSLLMLRPDPAGGGASVLGDLQAAAAMVGQVDRQVLRQPVFYEGRADQLCGVGHPLLPFPVLDDLAGWVRWAGKLVTDDRNRQHWPVLERFASLLGSAVRRVMLARGDLLIVDQRRIAHGRERLGQQVNVPAEARRLLCQAKIRRDSSAPVQLALQMLRSAT